MKRKLDNALMYMYNKLGEKITVDRKYLFKWSNDDLLQHINWYENLDQISPLYLSSINYTYNIIFNDVIEKRKLRLRKKKIDKLRKLIQTINY